LPPDQDAEFICPKWQKGNKNREQGTGNREQGTGGKKAVMSDERGQVLGAGGFAAHGERFEISNLRGGEEGSEVGNLK
jgi:hypothetical protein